MLWQTASTTTTSFLFHFGSTVIHDYNAVIMLSTLHFITKWSPQFSNKMLFQICHVPYGKICLCLYIKSNIKLALFFFQPIAAHNKHGLKPTYATVFHQEINHTGLYSLVFVLHVLHYSNLLVNIYSMATVLTYEITPTSWYITLLQDRESWKQLWTLKWLQFITLIYLLQILARQHSVSILFWKFELMKYIIDLT